MEATRHNSRLGGKAFETTQWSVVLAASANVSTRAEALEKLCRTYWRALYAYIRFRGHDSHQAQDLTQSFLASLLARDALENVRPEHGKFRSFLIASVNNFLANDYDRNCAAKRGGGLTILSLDEMVAEDSRLSELASNDDPEKALDRRWAQTILSRALQRLKQDFTATGRTLVFERLKRFLQEDTQTRDYALLAPDLQMKPGAVAVAVHRLRQRYQELVRREIAQTVARPEDIDDEMRHLLAVLSSD